METPRLYEKETAIVIRKVLKASFPAVKFSVRVGTGSMVSAVRISWTDGPTRQDVSALVECFREGHFDGMTDSYSRDNSRRLLIDGVHYLPGVEFVTCHRSASEVYSG